MPQAHTFVRVADDDHIVTGKLDNRVRLAISSVATLTFTPDDARTVAAGLLIAAEEVDPDPNVTTTFEVPA